MKDSEDDKEKKLLNLVFTASNGTPRDRRQAGSQRRPQYVLFEEKVTHSSG
jgi:hypothetical protein